MPDTKANNTMAYAIAREVGGEFPLNYFSFIDPENSFVYLATPGVAHLRTIGSLQYAVAQMNGDTFEIKNMKPIFNRDFGLIGNPKSHGYELFGQMLDDPSVIKFTFLRDPADRFAALYRSLLSIHTKRTNPRQKIFNFLGLKLEEDLSMIDLAELILEEPELMAVSPQLRTQRQMTAFELIDYNFIGRHETWETGFADVALEIFGEETELFNPVGVIANDVEGLNVKPLVSSDLRGIIKEVYAEDYDMLEEVEELYPDGFAQE